MEYSLLKDISPESHQWTIRTRVTRFSEYMSNEQPRRTPMRIDLLLLDETVSEHIILYDAYLIVFTNRQVMHAHLYREKP